MRLLPLLMLMASVTCAAEIELTVLPYGDDDVPRHSYMRSETPTVRVRVTNPLRDAVQGEGELYLTAGYETVFTRQYTVEVPAGGSAEVPVPLPLTSLKVAEYRLRARLTVSFREYSAGAPLWICPVPDTEGFVLATWWESAYKGEQIDEALGRLGEFGMTAVQVMHVSPQLLDRCLWHGINCISITHGNPVAEGFKASREELRRLNAARLPFTGPWGSETPCWGIANLNWQKATAKNLGRQIAELARHPAYFPRICTSDDYFRWTGLDYSPWNVHRFTQKHGIEPPRPQEALESDFPLFVQRPKGVIRDDDPWVQWLRFNSQDVLGNFNTLLTEAVLEATDGKGKIGPICGGGIGAMGLVPYVDMPSGQWPPFNFGESGFNLLCSYNYNFYWYPALAQVWWQELGRMGNRDLEQWLMPETMDLRVTSHLHNWHLYMASGVHGLAYFLYERNSPAADEALQQIGPLTRKYGKLLGELRPAPRPVGFLVPFENSCFDSNYLVEAVYAFCNLAMAHVDVEPVWPEELAERTDQYKVILLHNIDWLTQSNVNLLEDYIRRGGVVLRDSLTEVDVFGAYRLPFPLGAGDRRDGYGDLVQVARIEQALREHVRPWATSDDPHLLIRRFQAGGVDYLWVVNLMSREQDLDHVPTPGEERMATILPEYADFPSRRYKSRVLVPAGDWAVYDVLKGRRIKCTRLGHGLIVPVTMRMWQGCLLALYPSAVTGMEIDAPGRARQGRQLVVDIEVLSGRKPLRADVPLDVQITEPDGILNTEYSHRALARQGVYRFAVPFALNDTPGMWRLTVRELSAGMDESALIELRER